MKKLRIFLSAFAIALAVTATFAMALNPPIVGYRYIPAQNGQPRKCLEETVECVVSAPNPCTLGTDNIRRFNTETECGPVLKKETAN